MLLRIGALFLFSSTTVLAQPPASAPCTYSVTKKVAFRSAAASDKLNISIAQGACHSAQMTITIRTSDGRLLYQYNAPFKKHVAVAWNDEDLPKVAHKFVEETAAKIAIPTFNLPSPVPRSGITPDNPFELVTTKKIYDRLILTRQPFFYHPTHYEGGRFVVFDPAVNKSRVVIEWNL